MRLESLHLDLNPDLAFAMKQKVVSVPTNRVRGVRYKTEDYRVRERITPTISRPLLRSAGST